MLSSIPESFGYEFTYIPFDCDLLEYRSYHYLDLPQLPSNTVQIVTVK